MNKIDIEKELTPLIITPKKTWINPEISNISISSTSNGGSTNDDGDLAPTLS